MPSTIQLNVVCLPDTTAVTSAGATGVPYGISIPLIDDVTAATAAQTAAYPGAATQIFVRYFRKNQQLTGTYLVTQSVAAIQTAATTALPNALQTVHVVQFTNGLQAPGFAGAGTIYLIANSLVDNITAATAAQKVTYTNALTQINKRYWSNSSQGTGTMLVTEAVAAVIAAS